METLIAFGSAIKTLSDDGETLRFGGHLVLFGGPEAHDATPARDYFTKSTDFDLADGKGTSTVYYHHGLNPALKARPLGRASLTVDDAGVWMEGELKARDAYEAKILEMVRKGKLGLSSGTAVHLVERKAMPNSQGAMTHEITRWPLGLDASFTPTPGEPRTMATAIKSLEEVEAWEDELKNEEASIEIKSLEDALLGGLTLNDHLKKLPVAASGLLSRIEDIYSKRVEERDGYILPDEKRAPLLELKTNLTAIIGRIDAVCPSESVAIDVPEEIQIEAKADDAMISACLEAYALREARYVGVELN